MKKLLAILIINIGIISCTKEESEAKCYRCYFNVSIQKKYIYDTCVLPGQRAWRDETYNCDEDTRKRPD